MNITPIKLDEILIIIDNIRYLHKSKLYEFMINTE